MSHSVHFLTGAINLTVRRRTKKWKEVEVNVEEEKEEEERGRQRRKSSSSSGSPFSTWQQAAEIQKKVKTSYLAQSCPVTYLLESSYCFKSYKFVYIIFPPNLKIQRIKASDWKTIIVTTNIGSSQTIHWWC